jgi:drug/metabolite transporter (DMT)-like permease
MDGRLLQATSIAFVALPAIWIYDKPHPWIEWILFVILIVNGIVSFCFWADPIPKCDTHILDALLGRASMVFFAIYIFIIKEASLVRKFGFFCCLAAMMFCFHWSSVFSAQEWLCPMHVSWHMLFHGFIGTGAMFSFI